MEKLQGNLYQIDLNAENLGTIDQFFQRDLLINECFKVSMRINFRGLVISIEAPLQIHQFLLQMQVSRSYQNVFQAFLQYLSYYRKKTKTFSFYYKLINIRPTYRDSGRIPLLAPLNIHQIFSLDLIRVAWFVKRPHEKVLAFP